MKQIIFFLLTAFLFAGCQSNLTMRRMQAQNPLARNSVKTPTKLVDVWNTYAQSTPDGKALRGIAGRIHFYQDSAKKRAVKVDGEVTVFVFDGEEHDPAHAKPLKVYRFPADSLDKHYAHKKPLGHGYDFFLPFDELGGEEKKLCVMTRFDDRLDTGFVLSQPVNTLLQGTKPAAEPGPENSVQQFLASNTVLGEASKRANKQMAEQASPAPNAIQQVGYEQTVTNEPPSKERQSEQRRRVETVILNDSLTRRVSRASEQSVDMPVERKEP